MTAFAKLEGFIFKQLAATKLAGLSAAVVQGSETIWQRGFGFRDVEHGLPATPRTLYGIGSITKSFTCIAIMQLAEQGKLSIDDPISDYVPLDLKPGGEPIRLWHLMSHTSGLPALAYAEAVIDADTGATGGWLPIASYADMVDFLQDAGDWALGKPGTRYHYLNEGYVLLGAVIEQASGQRYEDYVRDHILTPLGMTRSLFDHVDWEANADAAVPYLLTGDDERIRSTYSWGKLPAPGGLISSAEEMAAYVTHWLRLSRADAGSADGLLLTPESVAAMQTPRITMIYENTPFGEQGYGFGLRLSPDFFGQRIVEHGGSVGTATAHMALLPESDLGIVLLTNGSGYPMSQFAAYGLALLLGEDADALPFVKRPALLDELTGSYETYKGTTTANVYRRGEMLFFEQQDRYGKLTTPFIPREIGGDARTFYALLSGGVRQPVEFHVQEDGRIDLIHERYLLRRTGPLT